MAPGFEAGSEEPSSHAVHKSGSKLPHQGALRAQKLCGIGRGAYDMLYGETVYTQLIVVFAFLSDRITSNI
jgi:hypothetical protein